MVDGALKIEHHAIDGYKIKLMRCLSREEQEKRKVLVYGIRDLSEKKLRDTLEKHGEVVNVRIPFDKKTNSQHGYAFIEFADTSSVDKVLSLGFFWVENIRVNVKKTYDKKDADRRGENRGGSSGGSVGRPGGSGPQASFASQENDVSSSIRYDEGFGVYSG